MLEEKTVLVVDDENKIVEVVKSYLEREGCKVFEAFDGKEALEIFERVNPDLIVLDLMLPDMTGEDICNIIRKKSRVPIIMLTAKIDEKSIISGLNIGADDYITKPFSPKVLIAKVKALLKRTREDLDSSSQDFNGLTINKLSHEVKIDGKEIVLSPKEYELLVYLITNDCIALTRDNILDNVWGIDYYGDIRTVDTNVKRLREKLLDKAHYIVTVRGSGYKFEAKQ